MITLFQGGGLPSDRVYLDQLEPTFDQLNSKSDIKDGSENNFTKQTFLNFSQSTSAPYCHRLIVGLQEQK